MRCDSSLSPKLNTDGDMNDVFIKTLMDKVEMIEANQKKLRRKHSKITFLISS